MTVGGQLTAWLAGEELSDKKLRKLVAELVDIAEQACRLGLQLEEELGRARARASGAHTRERNANNALSRKEARVDELIREGRHKDAVIARLEGEVERLREHSNGQQERLAQSFAEEPSTVQQVMAETAETHVRGRAELVQNMVELFRETLRGDVQ